MLYYLSPDYWMEVSLKEFQSGKISDDKAYKWRDYLSFNSFPVIVIYDSNYFGVSYIAKDGDVENYLLTRADVNLKFDSVDTKRIDVD